MNIVYRISAEDLLAYTLTIVECDAFCAKLIDKGIYPKVRRMKRSDVPLNEISLVIALLKL